MTEPLLTTAYTTSTIDTTDYNSYINLTPRNYNTLLFSTTKTALMNFTLGSSDNYSLSLPSNDGSTTTTATSLRVLFGLLLGTLLIVSVFGNTLVCFVILGRSSMRSGINLLLTNLAASQALLSIVCIPYALTTLASIPRPHPPQQQQLQQQQQLLQQQQWGTGDNFINRFVAFIFAWCSFVALYTVLTIGYERLRSIALRRHVAGRSFSSLRATGVSVCCWCLGLALCFPILSSCQSVSSSFCVPVLRPTNWIQPTMSQTKAVPRFPCTSASCSTNASITSGVTDEDASDGRSAASYYIKAYYSAACFAPLALLVIQLIIACTMVIRRWLTCSGRSCRVAVIFSTSHSTPSAIPSLGATSTLMMGLGLIMSLPYPRLRINNNRCSSSSSSNSSGGGVITMERRQSTRTLRTQQRTLQIVLIVIANYFVCWLLYSTTTFVWSSEATTPEHWIEGNAIVTLSYINACLCPIVYWRRMKKFRDACRDWAKLIRSRVQSSCRRVVLRRLLPKRIYPHISGFEFSNPATSFSQI